MKRIAVSYENGEIFQHFGRTEEFKVYDTDNGVVLNAEVIGTNGVGHEALADFLAANMIDVLICGGLGEGAKAALEMAGVDVFSGAVGDADEAVVAFLHGELIDAGVNCDHHHEDGDGCGSDCGGGCGGCGGGCGGCHPMTPIMEGKNVGKTCRTHYRGTLNDGTQFDSSYDRGEPLEFVCGVGMMIAGYDKAVANMEVGETVEVHIMPEEAYGLHNPDNVLTCEIAQLPGSEDLEVGQQVYLTNQMGQPIPVKVTAKDDVMITLDANHELAGQELNFTIELVEILDA